MVMTECLPNTYYAHFGNDKYNQTTFYTGTFGNCQVSTANNFISVLERILDEADRSELDTSEVYYKLFYEVCDAVYNATGKKYLVVDLYDWAKDELMYRLKKNNMSEAIVSEATYPSTRRDVNMVITVINLQALKPFTKVSSENEPKKL